MSVYTVVEQAELALFLERFDVGPLVSFEGINAGIENTNYFVNTAQGGYVLTLFEVLTATELPYFLEIMAHLAEHEVPSAHPVADNRGQYLHTLCGKPAALVKRLPGQGVDCPTVKQCEALGTSLGKMHRIGQDFGFHRDNERELAWCSKTATKCLPLLSEEDAELLASEVRYQLAYQRDRLPRGLIHADLFRDNALFEGDRLTGLIDFYYACDDVLLYDVAIVINDWCLGDGGFDPIRVKAVISRYQAQRPFLPEEQEAFNVMLRAAALRFWLSRLVDLNFPRPGEITHTKNPDEFKEILRLHHKQPLSL